MPSQVAILKTEDTEESIRSSLKQAYTHINDFKSLVKAKKIIIKVNLCKPFPADSGATVDPKIVEALINLIWKKNSDVEIYLTESNSLSRSAETAFRDTGYRQLEAKYDQLHLTNLSKGAKMLVKKGDFRYFKTGLRISYLFFDCDCFISIAKLKTHEFEKCAGIIKNQFGCLPTSNKEQYHPQIGQVLGDVNSLLRPDISIIDGIVAMEGKGPTFGTPKKMNLLIIGNDPVATDAVASRVMGFDPHDVPHLWTVAQRGLGEIESKSINTIGEPIEQVQSRFKFIPTRSFYFMRSSLKFHRLATRMSSIASFFSYFGNLSERLARSLYVRSVGEIITLKVFGGLINKFKTPHTFIKILISVRLALK
ncbi:MAG: DUF362 domain-containing protein [Candidatus Bathyarchaeota archaeon]|nr:MAG: DUF362 domain-containing protein [Candidatus Bathyarchaeota archaeon]